MPDPRISNPVWSSDKSIDVVFVHEAYGPMPYTVMNGYEEEMQAIWDGLLAGDYGPIAPYEAPPQPETE